MGPESEGVGETAGNVEVAKVTARIEATDGCVYEVDFYAENDWPLEASLSLGNEVIDVSPPGAKWAESKSGRKFAKLNIYGLARPIRLEPNAEVTQCASPEGSNASS